MPGEHVVLERSAVQMLLQVDGKRSVREIVGSRPLLPAMRDLALLIELGLIVVDDRRGATVDPPRVRLVDPPPTRPTPTQAPVPAVPAVPAAVAVETITPRVCPRLGFADDPTRHYSRPTALHRCFASGSAGLVSSQEQRELCLTGRFESCPRFRGGVDAATPPLVSRGPVSPPSQPEVVLRAPSAVPPGVAARLAAAEQLSMPGRSGASLPPPPPTRARPSPALLERVGRGPLLIAGGVLAGLLLVGLVFALLPRLQPGAVPVVPTPAPAFAPVATPPPAIVRTTPPTSAPTPVPAPTTPPAASRPAATASVAARTSPAAEAPRGQTLLDTRFAPAPDSTWLDNAPYTMWRDGAYRLAARQTGRFVAVGAPLQALDDAIISATLRKTGGPPGGGYGLIVRDQGPEPRDGTNQVMRAYVLETGDLGEWGVWRRDGDRWIDIVPWTRSPHVRPGGSPNELTVRTDGTRMTFSINGVEVATVDDDALPTSGDVGVFVGGDFNEVALDRFSVHLPD
jgi:hypothetical protein